MQHRSIFGLVDLGLSYRRWLRQRTELESYRVCGFLRQVSREVPVLSHPAFRGCSPELVTHGGPQTIHYVIGQPEGSSGALLSYYHRNGPADLPKARSPFNILRI